MRALTSGGLGAIGVLHHVRQVFVPRVLHGRLEDLPAVQVLRRPEVVPQVLHRLDVVLLLRGQDGVEGLQLRHGHGMDKPLSEERLEAALFEARPWQQAARFPTAAAGTSQWANLWPLIGANDLPLRAVMTIYYRYCGINVSCARLQKWITGSAQSVRPSILQQQKSFFLPPSSPHQPPNKRFVLLKVDRNSTKAQILLHRTLWRVCTEDLELANPRIVCIKDAAGVVLGSGGSSGFGIFCLSKLQTVKQSSRKAAVKYKVECLNCFISMY